MPATIWHTFHYTKIDCDFVVLGKLGDTAQVATFDDHTLIDVPRLVVLLTRIIEARAIRAFNPKRISGYKRFTERDQRTGLCGGLFNRRFDLCPCCCPIEPYWPDLGDPNRQTIFVTGVVQPGCAQYLHHTPLSVQKGLNGQRSL